jgi:hypothetical protein
MTPIEVLGKIKTMFQEAGELPNAVPSVDPVALADEYVLKSGTKVLIDKLEIGGKVTIKDESGVEQPAPMGEHELVDGTKIYLDELGVITGIELPEVAPEIEPSESAPIVEVEAMKKKIEEMQSELENMKSKFAAQENQSKQAETKFAKAISDLTDVVVGLCQTPAVDPEPQPNAFHVHVESKADKIGKFLEFAKNYKKNS